MRTESLSENLKEIDQLGHKGGWEDNLKTTDYREIRMSGMYLAQWRAVVKTIMNLLVLKTAGIFLTS
jgi:hypothetical protein